MARRLWAYEFENSTKLYESFRNGLFRINEQRQIVERSPQNGNGRVYGKIIGECTVVLERLAKVNDVKGMANLRMHLEAI